MPFIMNELETESFNATEGATVAVIDRHGCGISPFIRQIIKCAVEYVLNDVLTDEPYSPQYLKDYAFDPSARLVVGTTAKYLLENHAQTDARPDEDEFYDKLFRFFRVTHLYKLAGFDVAKSLGYDTYGMEGAQ